MSDNDYIKCLCNHCLEKIRFPAEGVGEEVECPHCHQQTKLYRPAAQVAHPPAIPNTPQLPIVPPVPPIIKVQKLARIIHKPLLIGCKTCNAPIAESAQICPHCGQKWPAMNLLCHACDANDFDLEVVEDNSSVWVTPSILGVLSAAVWETLRSAPEVYVRCLVCGTIGRLPKN